MQMITIQSRSERICR